MRLYRASIWLLLLWTFPAWAAPQPRPEQLKSAIIVNMARYIDWPGETFTGDRASFSICTLGRGRLAAAMEELSGTIVKGHPVTVRSMSGAADLSGCQLVVAATEDRRQLLEIIEKSRRQPVLTVGDQAGFSRDGGGIELYSEGNRIRFRINLGAARQNRLTISTHLLKLANDVIR